MNEWWTKPDGSRVKITPAKVGYYEDDIHGARRHILSLEHDPNETCDCPRIQREDPTRHFKECPKRADYPKARGQRFREMAERAGELPISLLAVPNNKEGAAVAEAFFEPIQRSEEKLEGVACCYAFVMAGYHDDDCTSKHPASVPRGHCGRCDRCGNDCGKSMCGPDGCSRKAGDLFLHALRTHCPGCGAPYIEETPK